MMLGCPAFESGVANYCPELAVKLYRAVANGEYPVAVQVQDQLLRLRDISHQLGRNIPSLHALIEMRGLRTGFPKRPFFKLSDAEIEQIWRQIQALDFPTLLARHL